MKLLDQESDSKDPPLRSKSCGRSLEKLWKRGLMSKPLSKQVLAFCYQIIFEILFHECKKYMHIKQLAIKLYDK